MSIVTIGIDLAKNVFAVHGVDEAGKAVLIKPRVSRDQLSALIAQLPPCVIGMEACSGAHHWARVFQEYGHKAKLMAPKLVAPYRDLPPANRASRNLVKFVFGEDEHEETLFGRANHRLSEGSRGRHAGQGAVQEARVQ